MDSKGVPQSAVICGVVALSDNRDISSALRWKNDYDTVLHIEDADNGEGDVALVLGRGWDASPQTISYEEKVMIFLNQRQAVKAALLLLQAVMDITDRSTPTKERA
jgi:hypothetical protein